MLISSNFVPLNFEILHFYDNELCFAWKNNKLVIFSYEKYDGTHKLETIDVSYNIRGLRCFDSRVFVLCEPCGVFKLSKTYDFITLSLTGIANGPAFYEIFIPENNWLVLHNVRKKINKKLFRLEGSTNEAYNVQDLTLNKKNSELSLRRTIHLLNGNVDEDVCIIANKKKVFKIMQNTAELIYRSEHEIFKIVGILRGESIAGIVFLSSDSAILAYVVKEKLIFDKVHLDSETLGLCAGISDKCDDTIWLAHIDGTRIHYWVKSISKNTFRKIKMDYAKFIAVKNYKSKRLICLLDTSELIEISIESLELEKTENEEFFALKPEMLKGTEKIVDAICEKTKELQNWNEALIEAQEKLKRINIYSHKQKIVYLPGVNVERIAGRLFAKIKFEGVLPLNCYVIVGLISNQRIIHCLKFVEDAEITMVLNLENERHNNESIIYVDLVTLAEESKAWCLIRNYTKNPSIRANVQISRDRMKFVKAKIAALRDLISEGGLTMKKLSTIKKSIRKELKNL